MALIAKPIHLSVLLILQLTTTEKSTFSEAKMMIIINSVICGSLILQLINGGRLRSLGNHQALDLDTLQTFTMEKCISLVESSN